MDDNEISKTYYIRSRGKVVGPFAVARLKTLHARGQFSRVHEVSTDRKTWRPASTIEGLFEARPNKRSHSLLEGEDALESVAFASSGSAEMLDTSVSDEATWYYHLAGQQHGPVPLSELRSLVRSGRLNAGDLAWNDSLTNWTPLGDIAELASEARASNAGPPAPSAPSAHQMFCFACGAHINVLAEICPKCGVRQRGAPGKNGRNRTTAALLAFFTGGIGGHHFYLGQPALGIMYLLFFWTFIPAIISVIEFIIYLCMSDESFDAKYNKRL